MICAGYRMEQRQITTAPELRRRNQSGAPWVWDMPSQCGRPGSTKCSAQRGSYESPGILMGLS